MQKFNKVKSVTMLLYNKENVGPLKPLRNLRWENSYIVASFL